eukprot:773059-Pelagomonas_calceolata.AAC.2
MAGGAQKCSQAAKVTSHSGDDVDADLLLEERRLLANAGGDPEAAGQCWRRPQDHAAGGAQAAGLLTCKLISELFWLVYQSHAAGGV